MSKEVRDFLRETVRLVSDDLCFFYGRESDFDFSRDKTYPACAIAYLRNGTDRTNDTANRVYEVTAIFCDLDDKSGNEEQSQDVLDRLEITVDTFMAFLNRRDETEDPEAIVSAEKITIENETREERIKFTSDFGTGWEVKFRLLVPDQFDYCKIYDQ